MRVTLNGIKRKGWDAWKGRDLWLSCRVRIWSAEHGAWWRPKAEGYTCDADKAGIFTFLDAWRRTSHCGPEKRIEFVTV